MMNHIETLRNPPFLSEANHDFIGGRRLRVIVAATSGAPVQTSGSVRGRLHRRANVDVDEIISGAGLYMPLPV